MQHAEVLRKLEDEIELNGSLRKAAGSLRISPQYLSAALSGNRSVGPKLLRALKLRRVITKTVSYEVQRVRR